MYYLNCYDNRKSFYNKACVSVDDGGKTLYSYNTAVARVDNNGVFHRLWGGYSATTMRHINSFLIDEGIDGGGKKWWDALPVE